MFETLILYHNIFVFFFSHLCYVLSSWLWINDFFEKIMPIVRKLFLNNISSYFKNIYCPFVWLKNHQGCKANLSADKDTIKDPLFYDLKTLLLCIDLEMTPMDGHSMRKIFQYFYLKSLGLGRYNSFFPL